MKKLNKGNLCISLGKVKNLFIMLNHKWWVLSHNNVYTGTLTPKESTYDFGFLYYERIKKQ